MDSESISPLNDRQKSVFNAVVNAVMLGVRIDRLQAEPIVQSVSDRLFFMDAPGETGKTFVASAVQRFLNAKGKHVVVVPSSAVAGQLHDDGRTAHSTSQITIPIDQDRTCQVPFDSPLANDLWQASITIWDDIVMSHRYDSEAVGRAKRGITRCNLRCGGKQCY